MNQKAFTLVEIIVVSIIVGLVGMMAIPNMLKMMNRSYAQDAMHNLTVLYGAQQSYNQNHAAYLSCAYTTNCNTVLGLNIVPVKSTMVLWCNTTTCTVDASSAEAGSFIMQVNLGAPITVNEVPVYCSGNLNPCCTGGGSGNCP